MDWAINQSYQLSWSFTLAIAFFGGYEYTCTLWWHFAISFSFFLELQTVNKVPNLSQISQEFSSFCTENVPRPNPVQLLRSCQPMARWFYERELHCQWASKDTPVVTPRAACPWTKDQIRRYSGEILHNHQCEHHHMYRKHGYPYITCSNRIESLHLGYFSIKMGSTEKRDWGGH